MLHPSLRRCFADDGNFFTGKYFFWNRVPIHSLPESIYTIYAGKNQPSCPVFQLIPDAGKIHCFHGCSGQPHCPGSQCFQRTALFPGNLLRASDTDQNPFQDSGFLWQLPIFGIFFILKGNSLGLQCCGNSFFQLSVIFGSQPDNPCSFSGQLSQSDR